MRKALVIVSVLLLTLAMGSVAYASDFHGVSVYGNYGSGSISFGNHGYSWYSDGSYSGGAVISSGRERYYYGLGSTLPVYVKGVYQDNSGTYYNTPVLDFDRDGQWEFYKDARGVLHYFYVDPDRTGQYQRYTDENGVTQYNYVYTGWRVVR